MYTYIMYTYTMYTQIYIYTCNNYFIYKFNRR